MAGLVILVFLVGVGGVGCGQSNGPRGDGGGTGDGALPDGATTDGATGDGAVGDGAAPDGEAGEVCNGLDDDGDGLVDEGLEAFCGPCGRPYDLTVSAPYPISGTWMYNRDSACEWQDSLEAFHRQGGQTVWRLGPPFEVKSANQIRNDPDLAGCTEGAEHCVDAALADLQAVNAGNTVANYLVYYFADGFSDTIMTCPALDRKIVVGARTYFRLVLPHSAGQAVCDFNGGSFDILFTWFEGRDPTAELLDVAEGLQMEVYIQMPQAPTVPLQSWNPDLALRPAFLDWSRRVLEDYDVRYGNHASLVGVYQSFEAMLVSSGGSAMYDTYGLLTPVINTALPGRLYALSPYWDVNVDDGNSTVPAAKEGFKRLARLGVDVIAPQDGRGTAKSALFFGHQADTVIQTLDPLLADAPNVVGTRTFAQQWNASTQQLYSAMRQAVDELDSQEGIGVTLWGNLEAFEPTNSSDCAHNSKNRTYKGRLDWALALAGAYPTRIISFMWDPYYLCSTAAFPQPLHDEILADASRPIASEAFFWNGGMVVRGFHLAPAGTTFDLSWYDATWALQSATFTPSSTTAGWGASNNRSPMLDEVWFPFDSSNLASSFYVHITARGPGNLSANHTFSLAY